MTKIPPSPCIHCGHVNDYAAEITGGNTVKTGDIAICFECAGVMTYDEQLRLTVLAKEVENSFDTQLKTAIRVARDAIARRKRKLN